MGEYRGETHHHGEVNKVHTVRLIKLVLYTATVTTTDLKDVSTASSSHDVFSAMSVAPSGGGVSTCGVSSCSANTASSMISARLKDVWRLSSHQCGSLPKAKAIR